MVNNYLFYTISYVFHSLRMEEIVSNGFARLNELPAIYQYTLGVIVAASFGVSASKFFGRRKITRRQYEKNKR